MGMFDVLNVAASGMTAQRKQMDVIAENIANVNTTHTLAGTPYRRKLAVFTQKYLDNNSDNFITPVSFDDELSTATEGVQVSTVAEDNSPLKKVYDPTNPDADKDGYVSLPNVDLITEMTNMIQASRAYEANATVINSVKQMAMKAMQIGEVVS